MQFGAITKMAIKTIIILVIANLNLLYVNSTPLTSQETLPITVVSKNLQPRIFNSILVNVQTLITSIFTSVNSLISPIVTVISSIQAIIFNGLTTGLTALANIVVAPYSVALLVIVNQIGVIDETLTAVIQSIQTYGSTIISGIGNFINIIIGIVIAI